MNNDEPPGLYVHVPFCRTKCPYCDFYSITSLSFISDWQKSLLQEMLAYKNQCSVFDSLYIGGGTPSVLSEHDLTTLFENLFNNFSFSPNTEITIEANPSDITREKLKHLKAMGVTRISIGVQSFDEHDLHFLGRRHTVQQAEQAIELIRGCGFGNLALDLIYGLPGQQLSAWVRTMKRALDFRPEHLSCYQLTVHEATPLAAMLAEGRMLPLGEEEERAFFLLSSEFLEERGYFHYEISNFASEKAYLSRHNCKYWRRVSYLGIGPAAHSLWEGTRRWNVDCVTTYCKMLRKGELPVAGSEILSEDQQRLESLYLGFRTREGIDLSMLRHQPDAERILARLQAANLVEVRGERVIPTRKGFVVADSFPLMFCAP